MQATGRRVGWTVLHTLPCFCLYFLDDHASEVHRRYSVASESGNFFFDHLNILPLKISSRTMRACTWPLGITRHGTAVQVAEQVPLSKLNAYQRLSVKSVPLSINFRVTLIQTAADKECYAATTLCHRLIVYYVLGGSVSLIFDGMTTVTTAIPSMYQLPKALNLAQPIGLIGVIIHGDHSSEVVHRKHCTFWIAQLRGARALWTFWQRSYRSSPCSACSFIERRWSAALIVFA